MERCELEVLLADFRDRPSRAEDPELAAAEAALFVELTFGLRLTDADITAERLGSTEALRRLLLDRMGGP